MIKGNCFLWLLLFFILSACVDEYKEKQEEGRDLSILSIGKWTFEEIAALDADKYDRFAKDELFQDIAVRYKKNKDELYYADEVDYKKAYEELDSIYAILNRYAAAQSCPNMVAYVDEYVRSVLNVSSRCYGGESDEKCWKRVWDYYDVTYKKFIFVKVKNANSVKEDLYNYLNIRSRSVALVYQDMNKKNYSWEDIKRMGTLYSYYKSLGVPIFEYNEVHGINRALYDDFYFYYISGRWQEIGSLDNPNICKKCLSDPCICYTECPKCHHKRIGCVCCKRCGEYPCICAYPMTPSYPGGMLHDGLVYSLWKNHNLRNKIDNYVGNYNGSPEGRFIHELRVTLSAGLIKVWDANERGQELYTIPVEAEDYGVVQLHGYSAYPDEIDIYCFAKAVETQRLKKVEIGIPIDYNPLYVMFFVTPFDVYALSSRGNLGHFFDAIPNEQQLVEFRYAVNDVNTSVFLDYNQCHYIYKFEYGEDRLYQMAVVLSSTLKCDIKILKLGTISREEGFGEGWMSEYAKREDDIRK